MKGICCKLFYYCYPGASRSPEGLWSMPRCEYAWDRKDSLKFSQPKSEVVSLSNRWDIRIQKDRDLLGTEARQTSYKPIKLGDLSLTQCREKRSRLTRKLLKWKGRNKGNVENACTFQVVSFNISMASPGQDDHRLGPGRVCLGVVITAWLHSRERVWTRPLDWGAMAVDKCMKSYQKTVLHSTLLKG